MNMNGMNLVQMAQEIENRRQQKLDMVVDSRSIDFIASQQEEEGRASTALLIQDKSYPLTEHANAQLATRIGIPKRYYDRMREEAPGLLENNVSHWFQENPEKHMVRTLAGATRALLSDRYKRIDNEQIAEAALATILDNNSGIKVVSCSVTDWKMYIQCLYPRLEGEVKTGDIVQGGFTITNGEIGNGALWLEPLVYRLVCTNGMVLGSTIKEYAFRRNHAGAQLQGNSEFIVYGDDTRRAEDDVLKLQIRDTVQTLADPAWFNNMLARMQATTQTEAISNPSAAVQVLAASYQLQKRESDSILENLIKAGDYSQWGTLNAVTATANLHDSYDRAYELEVMGAKVLSLKPSEWAEIAEAA